MNTEVADYLKQIELSFLRGLTPEQIVSHFAEVQRKFEALVATNDALEKEKSTLQERNYKQKNDIEKLESECTRSKESLNKSTTELSTMQTSIMRWQIEKEYADKLIATLKDIMSASLTRSALSGTGMFDFSGSSYSGGNGTIGGRGSVGLTEEVKKPVIK